MTSGKEERFFVQRDAALSYENKGEKKKRFSAGGDGSGGNKIGASPVMMGTTRPVVSVSQLGRELLGRRNIDWGKKHVGEKAYPKFACHKRAPRSSPAPCNGTRKKRPLVATATKIKDCLWVANGERNCSDSARGIG